MHGLGNDFTIIKKENVQNIDPKSLAIKIANRRTGIGCDQFILYSEDGIMEIYNQDGSSAKACGNASRCLVKLIFLETGQKDIGLKVCGRDIFGQIFEDDSVIINMGKVSFDNSWMPSQTDLYQLAKLYNIDPKDIICADVGNPHLVIFSSLPQEDKRIIGMQLQNSHFFPDGVNVNFAKIKNNIIHLDVWERGVGFTLACGSGATTTFASAVKLGLVQNESNVLFELGELKMKFSDQEEVSMRGDATLVCRGIYYA